MLRRKPNKTPDTVVKRALTLITASAYSLALLPSRKKPGGDNTAMYHKPTMDATGLFIVIHKSTRSFSSVTIISVNLTNSSTVA